MSDRTSDNDDALGLPELGDLEVEGIDGIEDDADADVRIRDDGGDPFDDSYADDVPLDVEIQTDHLEETAIGDASLGIDDHAGDEEVQLEEAGESMLDEGRGHAEEGLDFIGDDELGIDPIPTEDDDGGAEGLDDVAGERVDADEFPPLDGDDDDDDDELELGVLIDEPPAPDEPDEDERG